MSVTLVTDPPSTNGTAAAPVPLTSRVLQDIASELRSGRHPLVAGPVGDMVLLLGEFMPLPDAIVRMAGGPFDLVLRVNAVDGVQIVRGDDVYAAIMSGTPVAGGEPEAGEAPGDGEEPAPTERERRLATLRARTRAIEDVDAIATVRRCLAQCEHRVLVVIEQADILLQDPAQHDQPDRERVAGLQLGLREAPRVGRYRNTCVMIAGQAGGIPPVLLAGSEEISVIDMGAPSRAERVDFLRSALPSMHGACDLDAPTGDLLIGELAGLTDGDSLRSLESLAAFSQGGQHSVLQPRRLVNLHRFGDRPDYWSHLQIDACRARLEEKVFGQSAAIDAVMDTLSAAMLGLDLTGNGLGSESVPRGILWFVGPTGVGKTELAKAIAEAVFGDPEAYLRLDMTTFTEAHSAERLSGTSPGYVGFEMGGELTNAVRSRPNRVILLDEIEKCHPRVLERLMSVFDDGRITDGQGRVAYFGECLIVATSNEGAGDLAALMAREGADVAYEDIADVSEDAVRRYFAGIGRPEIFGRIKSGLVPFDVLRPEMIDRITAKFATDATFGNGPALQIDVLSFCAEAQRQMADPLLRALGGRQVRNVVQQWLRRLSSWLATSGNGRASTVRVWFEGSTLMAAADGRPSEVVLRGGAR